MIRIPAPDRVNGGQLTDELVAAGLVDARVVLNSGQLEVSGPPDEALAVVKKVVTAHRPAPISDRRGELARKARTGSLTPTEVQEALALLLGGG